MSLQKQIRRNMVKQTDAYLQKHSSVLQKGWQGESLERKQELAQLFRNGITAQDLDDAFKKGRNEAYQQTAPAVQKVVYSAFALVLNEKHGWDSQQCYDLLQEVDHFIYTTVSDDEIAEELLEKCGIRFDATEGVNRIQRVEKCPD